MKLFRPVWVLYGKTTFLLVTALVLSACASTVSLSRDQSSAYAAAMRGRSDEARTLLKGSSNDSLTTFMLACLELGEGNLGPARRYADEFAVSEPYVPDGKVLIELIEERKAYPTEGWTKSFADAWKAAGSPQLSIMDNLLSDQTCGQENKCTPREIPETLRGKPEELLFALDNSWGCDSE